MADFRLEHFRRPSAKDAHAERRKAALDLQRNVCCLLCCMSADLLVETAVPCFEPASGEQL